jgi:hypothetical protein
MAADPPGTAVGGSQLRASTPVAEPVDNVANETTVSTNCSVSRERRLTGGREGFLRRRGCRTVGDPYAESMSDRVGRVI